MGKRRDMALVPLEELRHLDHAVFGHLVIAPQSTSVIKEASMYVEKPKPEDRKLEKAKSDNAMVVNRQTNRHVFQRSGSFNSKLLSQKEGMKNDFKHNNGVTLDNAQITGNVPLKQWRSAEFPTMEEQRNMSGDCSCKFSTLPTSRNRRHDFQRSLSYNSALSESNTSDELQNVPRSVMLPKRKSPSFYGSSSISRESSIEEETECDDDCSVTSENEKQKSAIERSRNRRRVSHLVDELLLDIYGKWNGNGNGSYVGGRRRHSTNSSAHESDCCSTSGASSWKIQPYQPVQGINDSLQRSRLRNKSVPELEALIATLRSDVQYAGSLLVRQLKRRDALISRREKQHDVITAFLQALSEKRSQDTRIRFSVMPYPGDSGFTQWHDAMKMVARLPGGIPPEFRRRLWLTLAEKHLQARGVDWGNAERFCFNEWSNPDDDELGVQIVKDLHRTGCSLFCGAAAEENQALLKRVLLAYARWNKAVGYCQGFNMLAALILQVMDRSETDSVKVMIYLIEGVLPESYFANNLRGLSVDMAVFRDLLRLRLPTLSRHLEQLQHDARDTATGTSYEPPLTNVFTMQWFLTLFSNCLPQPTVLRVWDLIFLEGNEVLLRTALAIWDGLADRIMAVDSADEFYSIMGVLTREMLEFGLMDTNNLVKTIVTIAPFPFPELPELRDKYLYNITPWTHTVSTAARRGLRLFYSDDDDDGTDEDDEKIAVAAAYGISAVFRSPKRRDSITRAPSPSSSLSAINYAPTPPDRDRLALDISALKQQYAKLRERQRQAHIILTACARQPLGPSAPTPVAMNHLLLGKSALLSVRGRRGGPPPGAVPPPANIALKSAPKPHRGRQQLHVTPQGQLITTSNVEVVSPQIQQAAKASGETLHWKDMARKKQRRGSQHDIIQTAEEEAVLKQGIGQDIASRIPVIKEPGQETEKEEDAESEDSSSTSTELCDEPDRLSDFDSEEPTSISDASSYAPSAAEAIISKLPSPAPVDKSELPTPESAALLSPLEKEDTPIKPSLSLDKVIVPSKSTEVISSKTPPLSELVKIEVSPVQQPLILFEEMEEPTPPVSDKISPATVIPDVTVTFPVAESPVDTVELSSELEENAEPFSETKSSSPLMEAFIKETSPVKEILMLETTLDISLVTSDDILSKCVEFSSSAGSSKLTSPVESTSFTKTDINVSPTDELRSPEKIEFSDILIQPSIIIPRSPVTSEMFVPCLTPELKIVSSEKEITPEDEVISDKSKDYFSDDITKLESDRQFTEETLRTITPPSISERPDDQTDDLISDIPKDLSPIKMAASPEPEDSFIFEKTQDSWDITESLKSVDVPLTEPTQSVHDLKPISPITSLMLPPDEISRTTDGGIGVETVEPTIDRISLDIKFAISKSTEVEESEIIPEKVSKSVDDSEDISDLLVLNQRLHDRERGILEINRDQESEVEKSAASDIDYVEMTELLELDENLSLGRRNSERALQIIQENSEILQRILQCQTRRPSKLSEEESNGGTTTADSNLPSIPTSSSAENVDIPSCQEGQTVNEVPLPTTSSSDSCTLTVVSPKDSVPIIVPSEVSLKSPLSPWKPISSHSFSKVDKDREIPLVDIEFPTFKSESEELDKSKILRVLDTSQYSLPVRSEESRKSYDFLEPVTRTDEEIVPTLSSTRSFTLSPEIPSKKDHRFSLDSGITRFKTELKDSSLSSDEKFVSHSEMKTVSEISEDSDSKIYKSAELDKESFSSDWKRFSTLDNKSEGQTSQFPKRYSPDILIQTSYSSYSSRDAKESLYFLDSPLKPAKSVSSLKWTDDNCELRTDKRFSRAESDTHSHLDTSFSKFPRESTISSSWYLEKSKIRDDSSAVKSSFDNYDFLSHTSSSYSAFSSDSSPSKSYTSFTKYKYSPTKTRSSEKEFDIDYSSKYRESLPSWTTKDSTTRPSDNFSFKSSSDRTEVSPVDDYLQKSPYSKRRHTEDFQYSYRPGTTSDYDFSSGSTDVVRRATTRETIRPHSTIISDAAAAEILNRSYSSSSIDGYLTRSRRDLLSPSSSPDRSKSPLPSYKSVLDEASSLTTEKSRSRICSPIYEMDSPSKVSTSLHYKHSSKFDSKFSSVDLSPPSYTSFPETRWEKDESSIKQSSDTQTPSLETSLTDTSLSKSKTGKSYSPTSSPTKSKDIHVSLPPIKSSSLGSPTRSKSNFDPFPPRPSTRQPKELGIKLGLYSTDSVSKNGKASTKKT
ncbi:serine-rich adhesin for platelets-like isoform X2 [Periplaneta americana]|uniref:serine-rich adhesin for platelets-like isoform X2 n=1 Tax=Periplaneta americana TaxID=6978 RepID=UPI0037E9468F